MNGLAAYSQYIVQSGLSGGPSPERLATLTIRLKQVADDEMEGARHTGPPIACKKGCSHCCYQWVSATIPEVLHLAQLIGETHSADELSDLRIRIESYLAEISSIPREDRLMGVRSACPLLVDDLCSAFAARPMGCRSFNSIDVDACVRFRQFESDEHGMASIRQMGVGQELLLGFAVGLRQANLQEAIVDMVAALDIALNMPDAGERYLAGEPIFESTVAVGYDPSVIKKFAGS